jgi:hypothetical protein
VDKVFGLGYETPSGKGWIDGGDPTAGLLGKGTSGPFADFYQSPVGDWWVTPLFMVGLAGIGLGLSPPTAQPASAVIQWGAEFDDGAVGVVVLDLHRAAE